ncbi:hypothetical protein CR513_51560, partial [Mucuna pruriens]
MFQFMSNVGVPLGFTILTKPQKVCGTHVEGSEAQFGDTSPTQIGHLSLKHFPDTQGIKLKTEGDLVVSLVPHVFSDNDFRSRMACRVGNVLLLPYLTSPPIRTLT